MNNWANTPASTIHSLSDEESFHGSADVEQWDQSNNWKPLHSKESSRDLNLDAIDGRPTTVF